MDVTRRKLARMLAMSAAVPVAIAQTPAAPDSDDNLKSARDQMRNNAQRLAKVSLPMSTEPAFLFKA